MPNDLPWTPALIPDQAGRTAVVTGATSGIGQHTARELAAHGARVVLAVRDTTRGEQVADEIRTDSPGAVVEVGRLDLADLGSVRAFAEAWQGPLDLLVNNAGVMALPYRQTADGFEIQLGTNHLGHFALTGLLLPAFQDRRGARVVTVSSAAHRMGRVDFDDLQGERRYRKWQAYAQSKLANLLFAVELDRRLAATGSPAVALAAHPGYASTHLQARGPQMAGSGLGVRMTELGNRLFAQSAEQGAWPTLRAATDPEAAGGDYYGPGGRFETRGHPVRVGMAPAAKDRAAARRLWSVSEQLTGVHFLDGTAAAAG